MFYVYKLIYTPNIVYVTYMYLFCREIFVNNTDYLTNSDEKAEYLKTKDGIYLYKQRLVDYQHGSSRNINIHT